MSEGGAPALWFIPSADVSVNRAARDSALWKLPSDGSRNDQVKKMWTTNGTAFTQMLGAFRNVPDLGFVWVLEHITSCLEDKAQS